MPTNSNSKRQSSTNPSRDPRQLSRQPSAHRSSPKSSAGTKKPSSSPDKASPSKKSSRPAGRDESSHGELKRMDSDRQRVVAAGPSVMRVNSLRPMARPGFGREGRRIRVETNFFKMSIPRHLVVSQYSVQILRLRRPDDGDRRVNRSSRGGDRTGSSSRDVGRVWTEVSASDPIFFNRAVFDRVCRKYGKDFGCSLAYDGRSIAYAAREVRRNCLGVAYKVTVGREGGAPTDQEVRSGKAEEVQLIIEHAKYLSFDDILSEKLGTIASTEYLAALDVVIGTTPRGRYVQIGRTFYSSDRSEPLSRRSEQATASGWRGFYQSARLSQLGLVVNMDESCTAFWNYGKRPLSELIRAANRGRDLSCSDSRGLRDVASQLKALKVRAVHTGITYKVHGFSNKSADRIMFDSSADGRKVSIAEYFASTYNIRLKRGQLPCVKTHPKRDTYLPMEVLVVMENQRVTGLLSPEQTQGMVRMATSKPSKRREAAIKTMQRLNHSADPVCKDFGVQVAGGLIPVEGRVLPPPVMQYRNGGVKPSSGQWRAQKEKYVVGVGLYTWAVVNISSLSTNDIQVFVTGLVRAGLKAGMQVRNEQPRIYPARGNRIREDLLDLARKYKTDGRLLVEKRPLQLILIIKDKPDSPTYYSIKRTADLELGIASQVCLEQHCGRNLKGREMYCDNLMLKINSKMGGQNAVVGRYSLDRSTRMRDVAFVDTPHIVLGADVTHPVAGGRSPSVAALVGSRDRQGVQFTGAIRNQPGRQEVIVDIGEMFKEVYSRWRRNFKDQVHVSSIIMFRDGVSDGQFEEVMQVELAALRRACMDIGKDFRPRITYIIVTKRHHARFFPTQKADQDRSDNILAGTVIDRDITSREYYDFYLNSHAGILGTSKPSKYTVLIDENKIDPDALQGYIFRLAHGFVRCNRSVSMVNSAYYAHLLASRGRAYLGEDVSDTASSASTDSVPRAPRLHSELSKRLFFV